MKTASGFCVLGELSLTGTSALGVSRNAALLLHRLAVHPRIQWATASTNMDPAWKSRVQNGSSPLAPQVWDKA